MVLGLPVAILIGLIIGIVVNSATRKRRPGALIGLGIGGATVGYIIGNVLAILLYDGFRLGGWVFFLILTVVTIAGSLLLTLLVGSRLRTPESPGEAFPGAVGVMADGTPIYPVVGYTPQGQPVTADKLAASAAAWNPRTNSLAIVSLVLALLFPIAAIPTGHIARSQIRRTGEQGNGLALAGLIVGYIGVAIQVGLIVVLVVADH